MSKSAHPFPEQPRSLRATSDATAPTRSSDVTDELGEAKGTARLLFGLAEIPDSGLKYDKSEIERVIPHRGHMSLLDGIVWEADNFTRGIAMINARHDAFWVPGHFPGRAIMPGVLMVEAGAQLACYMYNRRRPEPKVVAFLRIENAVFRAMVKPGDLLLVLCQEVKFSPRRFICDIQGVIVPTLASGQAASFRTADKVAFDARISGMRINNDGSE